MTGPILGRAVAENIIRLAFGLSRCWENADYRKKRDEYGILDQEVDKFALLQVGVVDHAARKFGPHVQFTETSLAYLPGRHGHGLGLRGRPGLGPQYVCDIVANIQAAFPSSGPMLFSIRDGRGPWRLFEPMLRITEWDRWVTDGTKYRYLESKVVGDMASLVHRFETGQIIALGRHISPEFTSKAMRWLFDDLRDSYELSIDNMDRPVGSWWHYLSQAHEDGLELSKKAGPDRRLYHEARRAIIQATEDSEAKAAVLECRPDDEEIWESVKVSTLIPACKALASFVEVVWSAVQVGAKLKRIPLPKNCRLADEAEDTLRSARKDWEQSPASDGIDIPVDCLLEARYGECRVALRREFRLLWETLFPPA